MIRRSIWVGALLGCLVAQNAELCSQRLVEAAIFALVLTFFLDVVVDTKPTQD